MRPGECELCPFHGLAYCYEVENCLRADMNAPTERNVIGKQRRMT